ncbi:MAG: DNA mismatch repair protein MutS [Eubacteriales bacterium]|jgi:DNA mismatch repair protein MutS
MTPMMEQYLSIKEKYKDYILFYRLGDFYEMFFDDAIIASRELELTLTGRDCGEAERAPMCGVPYHSAETYIGKLIEKGYKIAICEQLEDPAQARGLVERDVVRIITPGTLIETDLLDSTQNNYVCAIYLDEAGTGVCFADISTAQVSATGFTGDKNCSRLINELATYAPREIITNADITGYEKLAEYLAGHKEIMVTDRCDAYFDYVTALESVKKQFGEILREEDFGDRPLITAIGALLGYIAEVGKSDISYIRDLTIYGDSQYLEVDVNTRRSLELTQTMRQGEKKGSLLWVLDKAKTAPGARLLRKWLESPLLNSVYIEKRLGAVEELFGDFMLREELSNHLSKVLDLERLITKVIYGTANGRDLRAVATTLAVLPSVRGLIEKCKSPELVSIYRGLDTLEDIYQLIDKSIVDDPPFSVREGGIIRAGYDKDVDYLRSVRDDGSEWIKKIADEEREKTGIKTLKVGYNRVFGYYIEVTKSFVNQVPDRYIRKQTLTNCERYITEELKDMESTILGATDKLNALEYELFKSIRDKVAENSRRIQSTAALLAKLDVYLSLATVAVRNRYVKPIVNNTDTIRIKDGRHPVVEQFVKDTYFVPNDTYLNITDNRLMLITGPNMAGKSTYMRQVALITIMAQMGSFVPAAEAEIGIVDKVFTRVGASDDLAFGRSTFMLEMNEVAYILKNATKKSLIIYDEIGRGTSTFDGMSIARATIEYTCKKIGAKTLFATHYHELTSLEAELEGVINYNIAAKKRGDNIIFLRKIVRGSTDDSYGIEVAKLAGVPNEVIKRAREVLLMVEAASRAVKEAGVSGQQQPERDETGISIDDMINEQVIEELREIDLNTLSPYEAMTLLYNLQKRLK